MIRRRGATGGPSMRALIVALLNTDGPADRATLARKLGLEPHEIRGDIKRLLQAEAVVKVRTEPLGCPTMRRRCDIYASTRVVSPEDLRELVRMRDVYGVATMAKALAGAEVAA